MEFEEWFQELLGLGKDWVIERMDFGIDPMNIHADIGYRSEPKCPACGKTCTRHDSVAREWKGLNLGRTDLSIRAIIPRIDCPDHGILSMNVPWTDLESHFRNI